MSRLTTNNDWERSYQPSEVSDVIFSPILSKYLENTQGKICLEIGCVPGNFLVWVAKTFGYKPTGIDYIESTIPVLTRNFEVNGIKDYEIIKEDFFKWKPEKTWDFVFSLGFIEHFSGDELDKVIQKHVDMVKPGGTLMLEVPNFNYGQYMLHSIWDRQYLKKHNISIMKRSFFREVARKHKLKIIYLGYFGGLIKYWGLAKGSGFVKRFTYRKFRGMTRIINRNPLKHNNPLFSPYLFFIAEKPE